MDYTRRRRQEGESGGESMLWEGSTQGVSAGSVPQCKKAWFGYRALSVPLHMVFEWEHPRYPACALGALTFTFALLWYEELSVLTSLSLLSMLLACLDYILPIVSDRLYSSPDQWYPLTLGTLRTDPWSAEQDAQFERVCLRLCHARAHLAHAYMYMLAFKQGTPFLCVMVTFVLLLLTAWIGSLIDNLLLLYITGMFVVLVPGLRQRGLLQQLTSHISPVFPRSSSGRGSGGAAE